MPETAVLDTNIWLDWLVFDDPSAAPVRARVQSQALAVLATPGMRAELVSVLTRPIMLARNPQAPARIEVFDAWVRMCAAPAACGLHCSDPDDRVFIDLACEHKARWLITKDRALLRLVKAAMSRYRVRVVTPLAFGMSLASNIPAPDGVAAAVPGGAPGSR